MTIIIDTPAPAPAGKSCPRCTNVVPVLVEGSGVCILCDGLITDGRWTA